MLQLDHPVEQYIYTQVGLYPAELGTSTYNIYDCVKRRNDRTYLSYANAN